MTARQLRLESFEDRTMPATFGVPWADPSRLTLSFASDGTQIAGRASNLFDSLNRDHSPEEWQAQILRAFYSWTEHTNLDVSLVPDNGERFGAPGRQQGDPRFGDIRIGGNLLSPEALAIASPPDPALSGTLAGDVFINTNYRFNNTQYNLQNIMLHEAGHVFGLDHSSDPKSPMYHLFNNSNSAIAAGDITNIQSMYGKRATDRHEGPLGNGSIGTASSLPVPTSYAGHTPLLAYGDLTTGSDSDVYWFDTLPTTHQDDDDDDDDDDDKNQNITIVVQSAGLSLLAPKVTVYYLDANGSPQEVASAKSDQSQFKGDRLSVTFDGNDDDDGSTRRYFAKVESTDHTHFQIGKYAIAVSHDGASVVPRENLDAIITSPYQMVGPDDLAALLLNPTGTLVNTDLGRNETANEAISLNPGMISSGASRFEMIGSLESNSDIDYYRLSAPTGGSSFVLTANAWALPGNNAFPQISIVDSLGQSANSEVLVNDNGSFTIQAIGLVPSETYFLRVSGDPHKPNLGNYHLTAHFGDIPTNVRQFAEGHLSADHTKIDTLYVAQAQLFHFALSSAYVRGNLESSISLSITDDAGVEVFSLSGLVGETVSGPSVLLRPGSYTVRFNVTNSEGLPSEVSYQLRGNRISDPVGPVLDDPTLKPEYTDRYINNQFRYPINIVSIDPFFWFSGFYFPRK